MALSTAGVPGFDPDAPSVARIWNYWLGGRNYLPQDAAKAAEMTAACPQAPRMVAESRMFSCRAAGWALAGDARPRIRQVIELGAGCPPEGRQVHDMARAVLPSARVAYVEHDPLTAAELAVRLGYGTSPAARDAMAAAGLAVVPGDLRRPAAVRADPWAGRVIDLAEPACLLAAGVLHLMPAAAAREAVARWALALAPGSVIAVALWVFREEAAFAGLREAWPPSNRCRHTRRTLAGLLDGLDLVPPGITLARGLRPGWADAPETPPAGAYLAAGIGRVR